MDSQPDCLSCAAQAHDTGDQREKEAPVAHVDPFLIEALQNPRHRLTVLRMELDIQRFMQKTEQQQFEFQHFPTSYLRLAAHRVAQHYGLHSMVLDNGLDTSRTRIIVQKSAVSQLPFVCLSEIPAKQPENEKTELVKIAIKTRPQRTSSDATELGLDKSPVRTVDERMEEYDKVRARIFSGSSGSDLEGISSPIDGRSPWQSREESKTYWNMNCEVEKSTTGGSSRVAIFRDREKDRSDPDYDRSYDRYVRSLSPNQNFGGGGPFTMVQPSFIQYETCFPQFGQLPVLQTPTKYQHSNPIMTPFSTIQTNQTSRGVGQMHWPCPSMMYAHTYQNFRQGIFQAPLYQQPLSFEYLQNH